MLIHSGLSSHWPREMGMSAGVESHLPRQSGSRRRLLQLRTRGRVEGSRSRPFVCTHHLKTARGKELNCHIREVDMDLKKQRKLLKLDQKLSRLCGSKNTQMLFL